MILHAHLVVKPHQPVDLGIGRHPGEHEPEAMDGPIGGRRAPLADHPPGERLGRLDIDRIIQGYERLQRGI